MVKRDMPKVIWDKPAYISLQKAYKRISEDSPLNAEKVRSEILKAAGGLPKHPEKYPLDRFKKDNPGNYRAFEKYSYRVAYKYTTTPFEVYP